MGMVMCHCPGEVIIVSSPLVLGPLTDDVLGVITSGWAPLCFTVAQSPYQHSTVRTVPLGWWHTYPCDPPTTSNEWLRSPKENGLSWFAEGTARVVLLSSECCGRGCQSGWWPRALWTWRKVIFALIEGRLCSAAEINGPVLEGRLPR